MNPNENDDLFDILSEMPEQLSILKEDINPSVSQDYVRFAEMIEGKTSTRAEIAQKEQDLFDTEVSPEEKKKSLVLLATQGTAETCLAIGRFIETATTELKDWGILALEQCLLSAESDLVERSADMIISGLGEEDARLRYFVAISAQKRSDLTAHQEMIERSFIAVCEIFDTVLESIEIQPDYATLLILVPLEIAVGTVVEKGIAESNRAGDWIEENYFATNTHIPEREELLSYLSRLDDKPAGVTKR